MSARCGAPKCQREINKRPFLVQPNYDSVTWSFHTRTADRMLIEEMCTAWESAPNMDSPLWQYENMKRCSVWSQALKSYCRRHHYERAQRPQEVGRPFGDTIITGLSSCMDTENHYKHSLPLLTSFTTISSSHT